MIKIFFGLIMFASDLLSMPFSVYDTFVIEEKYGFNKTTPKTFVLDTFKGWLLGALIGGGLLALIIFIYLVFFPVRSTSSCHAFSENACREYSSQPDLHFREEQYGRRSLLSLPGQ